MVKSMPYMPRSRVDLTTRVELEKKIEALEKELRRVKSRLLQYELIPPATREVSLPVTQLPFTRSTVSFRNKIAPATPPESNKQIEETFLLNGKRRQYTNGVLTACQRNTRIRNEWKRYNVPRYSRDTFSSSLKTVTKSKQPDRYQTSSEHQRGNDADSMSSHSDSETIYTSASDEQEITSNNLSVGSSDDSVLAAKPWDRLRVSTNEMVICSETAHDLLTRSHRLAQEAVYDAARQWYPNLWRHIKKSPREVMFGKQELDEIINHQRKTFEPPADKSWATSQRVENAIYDMIPLRNQLSNWRGRWSDKVIDHDSLVVRAHILVLVLEDESRATQIQEIRDEFLNAVEEASQRLNFATLPFSHDLEHI